MADNGTSGRLAGKRCVVTGAAQGIGLAIARRFLDEGAHVIASDLRFHDEADHPRIVRIRLDVTDAEAVSAAAQHHQDVDVLVNCVGYVASGALLDSSLDELDRSYAINVRSMAAMIRAFLPGMLERSAGSIVNIASVVSSLKAAPNRFAYATTKAAVLGLTKSIALDYVDRGIRCNSICPGTIETPSLHERFAATGDAAKAHDAFVARQPMGRLGQADEIAATAVLLASDEAPFMTGASVVVDGGMSL